MSITDAGVDRGSRTLADRFATYLENVTSPSDIALLVRSFELSLRAANRSPKTIKSYTDTVRGFCMFLVDNGMPTDARNLTREHVETYISVQVERFRPKTASIRFGDLQQFFKWAVEEREMDSSPMINMRRPHVPEEPPPVLTEDDLRALLKTCSGPGFEDRRDTAIIRLFVDSGMRLSELTGLSVDDLDLDVKVAYVIGKGRRPRECAFGAKTAQALDRYLRLRRGHRLAHWPGGSIGAWSASPAGCGTRRPRGGSGSMDGEGRRPKQPRGRREGRRRRFQSDASGRSWIIISPHTGHAPVAACLPLSSRIVLPVNGRCSVQIMQ